MCSRAPSPGAVIRLLVRRSPVPASVLTLPVAGNDFSSLYLRAVMTDGPGERLQRVSRLARDVFPYMGPEIRFCSLFLLFSL